MLVFLLQLVAELIVEILSPVAFGRQQDETILGVKIGKALKPPMAHLRHPWQEGDGDP